MELENRAYGTQSNGDRTRVAVAHELPRRVAGKLFSLLEEERRRIARELHDDIGQQIALAIIRLEALRAEVPPRRKHLRRQLTELSEALAGIATATSNLSHGLHPARLHHLGLPKALEGLCREISTRHGVEVTFCRDDDCNEFPPDVGLCVYRVAQEALNNVLKHSESPRATVSLTTAEGVVKLLITDYGQGLQLEPDSSKAGLGLFTMRERVELLGGHFVIHSGSTGTQVEATVPLPAVTSNRTFQNDR
jgi:signal transduction histidine kinase